MARPRAGLRRAVASPRVRIGIGWLAALALVVGIAFVVGRMGATPEPGVAPGESGSASPTGLPRPIAFGTQLDPITGEVADEARADRFASGDNFAWSADLAAPPPARRAYVEVVRVTGGSNQTVQAPALHVLAPGASVIAFEVPADRLLTEFGVGEFEMRIYLDPAAASIAMGRFQLIGPLPAAS